MKTFLKDHGQTISYMLGLLGATAVIGMNIVALAQPAQDHRRPVPLDRAEDIEAGDAGDVCRPRPLSPRRTPQGMAHAQSAPGCSTPDKEEHASGKQETETALN